MNLCKTVFLFAVTFLFAKHLFAQLTITSFSPTSGNVGTIVTLTGNNFDPVAQNNIVFFGAGKATVVGSTTTSIRAIVPFGATYQSITLTANNLTAYSNKPFIVTFAGGENAFTSKSFSPKVSLGTSDNNPWYTTPVDLDGDGKLDIAFVTEVTPPLFQVFKNYSTTSAITFSSIINFSLLHKPVALAIADLDGDGKPDVVLCSTDNTIAVCKNTSTPGTISFATERDFPGGYEAWGVGVRDFDNDGRPDIVVTSKSTGAASILRNTSIGSNISFSSPINLQLHDSPQYLAIEDLDGNGLADLVVSDVGSNNISIYRNTSSPNNISFAPKVEFNTSTNPRAVSISDFDNDGKPDLAVSVQLGNIVSIFKNTCTPGTINFNLSTNLIAGNQPYGIAVDDINGDGLPDIVASNAGESSVSVFRNNSSGGNILFGLKKDFPTHLHPYGVYIADFDSDGKPDLSAGCPGETYGEISILKNKVNNPAIFSFNPTKAYTGFIVTIKGSNFTSASSITFGTSPAQSFNIISDSIITAVVGSGSSGNVYVTNQYGTDSLTGFTFTPPPVILDFTPTSAAQGNQVRILGSNFIDIVSVKFGGVSASSYFINGSYLYANVDTGASGNVSVTTATGTAVKSGFSFIPKPTINSFTPSTAGSGSVVIITGSNFIGTTSVKFGLVNASSLTVISKDTINAVVGGVSSGNVTVVTPGGTATLQGFVHAGPVITNFSAATKCITTGSVLLIKGKNFTAAISVKIGGSEALSYNILSDTIITATAAIVSTGTIDVTTAAGIAIFAMPSSTISSISPSSGAAGTIVTIRGTYFCGVSAVKFGSIPASSFTVVSDSVINAVIGNGASGIVTITTLTGNYIYNGFTYTGPSISFLSKNSGSMDDNITIYGSNFTGVSSVKFGGVEARSFSVISSGIINSVIGSGASGNISVITPNGLGTLQGFVFISPAKKILCPPLSSTTITSNITGSSYQWQIYDNTLGFVNITDNSYYNNTNTATLSLLNIPSSWYGYTYRCISNGISSTQFRIEFSNVWTNTLNSDWENIGNWSCNQVPDSNTDVLINSGNVVINSNVTIRSITISPSASLNVINGNHLNVLH